jgi:hypothetical protein
VSKEEPRKPEDPLATVAALIRDVGQCAQCARRYGELAASVADPIFDRALALGSDVRRAARGAGDATAVDAAITELQSLLAECEASIARVRNGATYQEAATAFAAGAAARVAALAPAIFTDVTPYAPTGSLFWSVPIGSRRSETHFVPPEELAVRLRAIATEGLRAEGPPPELGGDEVIRPIVLATQPDDAESPITLAYDARAVAIPVCALAGTDLVLLYAERLVAPFAVTCSPSVDDEWWTVRPDAYRDYLEALRTTLSPGGLSVVVEKRREDRA